MSTPDQDQHHTPGMFENMASLDDQGVWDLLEMLHGLIDAYEEHYADPLRRLRTQRYQELLEQNAQLRLALQEHDNEPF